MERNERAPKAWTGDSDLALSAPRGRVLPRRLRQCVCSRASGGGEAGRTHHRRSLRDAAAARAEESAVHGDGRRPRNRRRSRRSRPSNRTPTRSRRASFPRPAMLPLPTQEGKIVPYVESGDARLFAPDRRIEAAARTAINCRAGIEACARGHRTPKPKPRKPPLHATAAPVTTPEPEQFAMLKSTPPPPIKAPDETEPSPPRLSPTPRHHRLRGQNQNWPLPIIRRKKSKLALPAG